MPHSSQKQCSAFYLLPLFILAVALLPQVILAQETAADTAVTEDNGTVLVVETTEEVSADALLDNTVSYDVLGVEEAVVLQDSFFYSVKRFGRKVKEAVTFNPVKKAELRLQHANQELVDAKQLLDEKKEDPKAVRAVAKAVNQFEQQVQAVQAEVDELDAEAEEDVDLFLDELFEAHVEQQKLLDAFDEELDEIPVEFASVLLEELVDTADEAAEVAGVLLSTLEDDEVAFVDRFDRVLAAQEGSEFHTLRHLDVLRRVEDNVAVEFKDAFHEAEEKQLLQFQEDLFAIPEEERKIRFEQYLRDVDGDELYQLEVFDRLKQLDEVEEDFLDYAERGKDIVAARFQERVEYFEAAIELEADRDDVFEDVFYHFRDTEDLDVDRLRALEELSERVQFEDERLQEEIEAEQEASIAAFTATFTDDESAEQAARFRMLSAQMAAHPDATTFRLLQELEEEVAADPEKRAFIEEMERESKLRFAERAQEEGEAFLSELTSSNPEDLDIFATLQEEFEADPDAFFDVTSNEGYDGVADLFGDMIEIQTDALFDYVAEMEDPRDLRQFEGRVEDLSETVLQALATHDEDFFDHVKDKERVLRDKVYAEEQQAFEEDVALQRIELEEAFQAAVEEVDTEEERDALEEEYFKAEADLFEEVNNARRAQFEAELAEDPFCDEACERKERLLFNRVVGEDMQALKEEHYDYLQEKLNPDTWLPPEQLEEMLENETGAFPELMFVPEDSAEAQDEDEALFFHEEEFSSEDMAKLRDGDEGFVSLQDALAEQLEALSPEEQDMLHALRPQESDGHITDEMYEEFGLHVLDALQEELEDQSYLTDNLLDSSDVNVDEDYDENDVYEDEWKVYDEEEVEMFDNETEGEGTENE